jgi:hypothetical protein
MPTIDELTNKTKRKFVKSEYRPWNYMDTIDKELIENQLEIIQESYGDQLETTIEEPNLKLVSDSTDKKEIMLPVPLIDQETTLDVIFRLTGHQKIIFLFIVDRCMSRGLLVSGVIKGETLVDITETTMKMVKTSIQRLVAKKLIIREKGKTGRGGFYIFRITEIIRNSSIEYKRMVGIGTHLEIKKESNSHQLEIISSSRTYKKNSTLPSEWENINISPLEDIGFNHNHLIDIYEPGLSDVQMVQDSIMHFSYGLEYEKDKYKQYTDLLNVLIGRLRKGKPWYEQSYRSPQELAQIKFLENKKAELERKKIFEDESYKLAFNEWQQDLTTAQIEQIAPKGKGEITPQPAKLSIYFKENIWPSKKAEYLIGE